MGDQQKADNIRLTRPMPAGDPGAGTQPDTGSQKQRDEESLGGGHDWGITISEYHGTIWFNELFSDMY